MLEALGRSDLDDELADAEDISPATRSCTSTSPGGIRTMG